jgi:hypothetical protein
MVFLVEVVFGLYLLTCVACGILSWWPRER